MSRPARATARVTAFVTAVALACLGVFVAAGPAAALPNCNVTNPPPICGGTIDPPSRLPDLTASVTGPASAVGGTSGAYSARVTNISSATGIIAPSVAVRISASGGAVVTAAALTGWSCSIVSGVATCSGGSLANGATASIPVTVTYPNSAASVVVTTTADPANALGERSETNNSGSTTTAVSAPSLPDLTVSMTGPGPVRGLYANGTWTMTVTNVGTAPATVVNVRWLTNWGGDVNAYTAKSGAIGFSCIVPPEYMQQIVYCYGTGTLQPGASATIEIHAVPPAPANVFGTAGVSNVTATVDYGSQVVESNETNNSATVVSTILP
jgi:hypothetical protein